MPGMQSVLESFDDLQIRLYNKVLTDIRDKNPWINGLPQSSEDITDNMQHVINTCLYFIQWLTHLYYDEKTLNHSHVDSSESIALITRRLISECLSNVFGFTRLVRSSSSSKLSYVDKLFVYHPDILFDKRVVCLAMMDLAFVRPDDNLSTIGSMQTMIETVTYWWKDMKTNPLVQANEVQTMLSKWVDKKESFFASRIDHVERNPLYWMSFFHSSNPIELYSRIPVRAANTVRRVERHDLSYFFSHLFLDLFCGAKCGLPREKALNLFKTYIDNVYTIDITCSDLTPHGMMYGTNDHAVVLGEHDGTFYVSNSGYGVDTHHPRIDVHQHTMSLPFYLTVMRLPDCGKDAVLYDGYDRYDRYDGNKVRNKLWSTLCSLIEIGKFPLTIEDVYREFVLYMNHTDAMQQIKEQIKEMSNTSSASPIYTEDEMIDMIKRNDVFMVYARQYYDAIKKLYPTKGVIDVSRQQKMVTLQNHHFLWDDDTSGWLMNPQICGSCTFWSQMNWYIFVSQLFVSQLFVSQRSSLSTFPQTKFPQLYLDLSVKVMESLFEYSHCVGLIRFLDPSCLPAALPRVRDMIEIIKLPIMSPKTLNRASSVHSSTDIFLTDDRTSERNWGVLNTRIQKTLHWTPSIPELQSNHWSYFFKYMQLYRYYNTFIVNENIVNEFYEFLRPLCQILIKRLLCSIVHLIENTSLVNDFPKMPRPHDMQDRLSEHEAICFAQREKKKRDTIQTEDDRLYFRYQILFYILSFLRMETDLYPLPYGDRYNNTVDMTNWWMDHFYLCDPIGNDFTFSNHVSFSATRMPVTVRSNANRTETTIYYCTEQEWENWSSMDSGFYGYGNIKTCCHFVIVGNDILGDDLLHHKTIQTLMSPTFALMYIVSEPSFIVLGLANRARVLCTKDGTGTYHFKNAFSSTCDRKISVDQYTIYEHVYRRCVTGPFDTSFIHKLIDTTTTYRFPYLMTRLLLAYSPLSDQGDFLFRLTEESICTWNFAGQQLTNSVAYQMELWCDHLVEYNNRILHLVDVEMCIPMLLLCFQLELARHHAHRTHRGWVVFRDIITFLREKSVSEVPSSSNASYIVTKRSVLLEIASLVVNYSQQEEARSIVLTSSLCGGIQQVFTEYSASYNAPRHNKVVMIVVTYFHWWCSMYLPDVDLFDKTKSDKQFILSTSMQFQSIQDRFGEEEKDDSGMVTSYEVVNVVDLPMDTQNRLELDKKVVPIEFIQVRNVYDSVLFPMKVEIVSAKMIYRWKYAGNYYDVTPCETTSFQHELSFLAFFPTLTTTQDDDDEPQRLFMVHPLLVDACVVVDQTAERTVRWIDDKGGQTLTLLPPSSTLWLTGMQSLVPCWVGQPTDDLRYTLVFLPTTYVPSFGRNDHCLFDDNVKWVEPFEERVRWIKLSDDQWEIDQCDSVDTLGFVFCLGVWAQQEWIVRRLLMRVLSTLQYYTHQPEMESQVWYKNCLSVFQNTTFGSPLSSYIAHVLETWNKKTNCFRCLPIEVRSTKWSSQKKHMDFARECGVSHPTSTYCPITMDTVQQSALPFTETYVPFCRDRWLHPVNVTFEHGYLIQQFRDQYDKNHISVDVLHGYATQIYDTFFSMYTRYQTEMKTIEYRLPCPYRGYVSTLINTPTIPISDVISRITLLWKIAIYGYLVRVVRMIRNAKSKEDMDRPVRQFFTISDWYGFTVDSVQVSRMVMQMAFEISVCFVLKKKQMDTIELLLAQLSTEEPRPVLQQIMGSGKSAVIVPYLTMYQLVTQSKTIVALVQPSHLKQACFQSIQRILVPWLMHPFQVVTPMHSMPCHQRHWMSSRLEAFTIVIASDTEWKSYYLQSRLYQFDWGSICHKMCVIIDEFDTLFLPTSSEVNVTMKSSLHQMGDPEYQDKWLEWYTSLIVRMMNGEALNDYDDRTRYRRTDGTTIHSEVTDSHFYRKIQQHILELSVNDINVRYGFTTGTCSAVPYLGLNTPNPGSRFSDPDLTCVLTVWLFYRLGLQSDDKKWVISMINEDESHPIVEYMKRTYATYVQDKVPWTSFMEVWAHDTGLIDRYLTHVVIPSICTMPSRQKNVSFIDVIDRHLCPYMVGFSGTTTLETTIDSLSTFQGIHEDTETGEIIRKQLTRWPSVFHSDYVGSDGAQHWMSLWRTLMVQIATDVNCIAMIDEAAWVRYTSPEVFLQQMYDMILTENSLTSINEERTRKGIPQIRHVQMIYFDSTDVPRCLPPQFCQTQSFPDDRLTIILYDQKHIIGTDLTLPNQVRGFVSIHEQSRFSIVAQAAFRLRGLAVESPGHSVQFVTTPPPPSSSLARRLDTSIDVLDFIIENEGQFKANYRHSFLQQVLSLRWRSRSGYDMESYTRYTHHPSLLQGLSPDEMTLSLWPRQSHAYLRNQSDKVWQELLTYQLSSQQDIQTMVQADIAVAQNQSQEVGVAEDLDVDIEREMNKDQSIQIQKLLNAMDVPQFNVPFTSIRTDNEWWTWCLTIPAGCSSEIQLWYTQQNVRCSPELQIILSNNQSDLYFNKHKLYMRSDNKDKYDIHLQKISTNYECPLYQIYIESEDMIIWVTHTEFTLDTLYNRYRPDILYHLIHQYKKSKDVVVGGSDVLLHRIQMLMILHVLTHTRIRNTTLLNTFLLGKISIEPKLLRLFTDAFVNKQFVPKRTFWANTLLNSMFM